MGKNKSAQVVQPDKAVKSSKDSQVKSLSSVKHGAVTKPSQTPKSKSKEVAKQVAAKADKADKKSKKAKKEPTPDPSSESESGSEEDSASGSSSDEDSDAEVPKPNAAKSNGVKTNGAAKAAAPVSDSDSSESSSSSDDEADAPQSSAPTAVAGAKDESGSDEDSEGSSDGTSEGTSEESSEEEKKLAVNVKSLNSKLEAVASNQVSAAPMSTTEHRAYVNRLHLMKILMTRAHRLVLQKGLPTKKTVRKRPHLLPRSAKLKRNPHQP